MRAALLQESQSPLALVADIEVEDPRPGEVLVKVSHCGICHSDLTVVDTPGGGQLPVVLGHEAQGLDSRRRRRLARCPPASTWPPPQTPHR